MARKPRDYKAEAARRKARAATLGTTPAKQRVARGLAKGQTKAAARGHGAGEHKAQAIRIIKPPKTTKSGAPSLAPTQFIVGPYVHRPGTKQPPPLSRARRVMPQTAIRAIQKVQTAQVRIAVWGIHTSAKAQLDWKIGRGVKSQQLANLRAIVRDLATLREALQQQAITGGVSVPGKVAGPLPLAQAREIDRIVLRAEYEAMNDWATQLMQFDGTYSAVFALSIAESR